MEGGAGLLESGSPSWQTHTGVGAKQRWGGPISVLVIHRAPGGVRHCYSRHHPRRHGAGCLAAVWIQQRKHVLFPGVLKVWAFFDIRGSKGSLATGG